MTERRRIRFVSYSSATVETMRTVRKLAGLDALAKLDGGEWIEFDDDDAAQAQLEALAAKGVEYEFYVPPPPAPPVEPAPRVEVPADLDLLASLHYPKGGGGGLSAARLMASRFDAIELEDALGLMRAGGELARGLPLAEAQAHADALAEVGARVEVVLATSWTYAFDPGDPEGADQQLERMRVVGAELEVERGQLGDKTWAPVTRERYASGAEHEAAVAARHHSWKRAGRRWTETPAELVTELRARNPVLEGKIRAAEDPRPAIGVYTDWLRAQGDPLGTLDEAGARGEKAFLAALARYDRHLFWPLGEARQHVRLTWAHGLVHAARVELPKVLDGFETDMDFVAALLDLPCCASLRELELHGRALDVHRDSVIEALPGLRKLTLDGGLIGDVSVSDWSRFRRVEALELRAHHPRLAPIVLPRLRRLRFRFDRLEDDGVETFEKAELGALEQFELIAEDRAERADRLERVLNSPAIAGLRSVRLEIHVGRIGKATIDAITNSRLYRNASSIELVAELDEDAEELAGRATPTLRVIAPAGPVEVKKPKLPWRT